MALDANEVRVAISGEIYVAPVGTAAPTNASTPLAPGWVGLGYVHEDGITESYEEDSEAIPAWQNAATVRNVTTASEARFEFSVIQSSPAVIELYHKGSEMVEVPGGEFSMKVKAPTSDVRAICIDVVDGDRLERIYMPSAEVVERGEITYASSEAVGYALTIAAYAADLGDGVTGPMEKFWYNPTWSTGS